MAEEGDDERRPSDDGAGSDAGKGGDEAEATMSHADEEEPMPDDDADVDPKKVRVARSSRERIGAVTTAAPAGESCSGRQSLGSTINGSAHLAPSGALDMRIAMFPSAAAESEDGEDQGPESGDAPAIVRHPPAHSTTAKDCAFITIAAPSVAGVCVRLLSGYATCPRRWGCKSYLPIGLLRASSRVMALHVA